MSQYIWIWGVGNGGHHFLRDGKKSTETECTTWGPWFGKFMKGYKLRVGLIKKQYFRVTSEMVKDLLVGWDIE